MDNSWMKNGRKMVEKWIKLIRNWLKIDWKHTHSKRKSKLNSIRIKLFWRNSLGGKCSNQQIHQFENSEIESVVDWLNDATRVRQIDESSPRRSLSIARRQPDRSRPSPAVKPPPVTGRQAPARHRPPSPRPSPAHRRAPPAHRRATGGGEAGGHGGLGRAPFVKISISTSIQGLFSASQHSDWTSISTNRSLQMMKIIKEMISPSMQLPSISRSVPIVRSFWKEIN